MNDPSTTKSRTGYVVMFARCPLVWALQLQTEVALLTTASCKETNAWSSLLTILSIIKMDAFDEDSFKEHCMISPKLLSCLSNSESELELNEFSN